MAVKKPKAKSSPGGAIHSAKKSPKTAARKAAPKKAAPAGSYTPISKKSAPARLTASQQRTLKKIALSGQGGYLTSHKAELRTLNALRERKLIKRVASPGHPGRYRYLFTAKGLKQLGDTGLIPAALAPGGLAGDTDTEPPKPKR
jgi:hypothetical protein